VKPISKMLKVLEILEEEYPYFLEKPSMENPFKTLIGCILSQRTRDVNSEEAVERLFSIAKTPQEILELSEEEINRLIRCAGFYRQKTRYIIEVCKELLSKYNGKVPSKREDLLSLDGVGPKTADIVITYCYGGNNVPVDVHIRRVTERLGFTPLGSNPTNVGFYITKLVPEDLRVFYDRSILKIGKEYCRKTDPRCSDCPLRGKCSYVLSRDRLIP
jgi:endonuclease-3